MFNSLKAIGKRWKQILIFMLLATIIFAGLEVFVFPRRYEAGVQMYVRTGDNTQQLYTELQASSIIVTDYMSIATSEIILKEVMYNLQETYPQITDPTIINVEDNIRVEAVNQTRIFWIYVSTENPELSAAVANEIARTMLDKDLEITGFESLYILADAAVPGETTFPKYIRDVPICAGAALLLGVAVALFIDYWEAEKKKALLLAGPKEDDLEQPRVEDAPKKPRRERKRKKEEQRLLAKKEEDSLAFDASFEEDALDSATGFEEEDSSGLAADFEEGYPSDLAAEDEGDSPEIAADFVEEAESTPVLAPSVQAPAKSGGEEISLPEPAWLTMQKENTPYTRREDTEAAQANVVAEKWEPPVLNAGRPKESAPVEEKKPWLGDMPEQTRSIFAANAMDVQRMPPWKNEEQQGVLPVVSDPPPPAPTNPIEPVYSAKWATPHAAGTVPNPISRKDTSRVAQPVQTVQPHRQAQEGAADIAQPSAYPSVHHQTQAKTEGYERSWSTPSAKPAEHADPTVLYPEKK